MYFYFFLHKCSLEGCLENQVDGILNFIKINTRPLSGHNLEQNYISLQRGIRSLEVIGWGMLKKKVW